MGGDTTGQDQNSHDRSSSRRRDEQKGGGPKPRGRRASDSAPGTGKRSAARERAGARVEANHSGTNSSKKMPDPKPTGTFHYRETHTRKPRQQKAKQAENADANDGVSPLNESASGGHGDGIGVERSENGVSVL